MQDDFLGDNDDCVFRAMVRRHGQSFFVHECDFEEALQTRA